MNANFPDENATSSTGADQQPEEAASDDWYPAALEELTVENLEKLIARAEAGNARAIAALVEFQRMGGSPSWRALGDLADVAEKMLAMMIYPGRKGPPLAVRRRFQDLREELAADHATPLEKLALDRVILASMFANAVDYLVAAEGPDGLSSEKRIRAQAAAEKRFQAAMKSLKTAREICRTAVAGPIGVFGSRPRSVQPASRAAG